MFAFKISSILLDALVSEEYILEYSFLSGRRKINILACPKDQQLTSSFGGIKIHWLRNPGSMVKERSYRAAFVIKLLAFE